MERKVDDKGNLFLRLSKEDLYKLSPSEKSQSIKNQEIILRTYALENGWNIVGVFDDEDYSGSDRERPNFNKMINECKEGNVDIVLVKTQARFARDIELVNEYVHNKFRQWNVRFVTYIEKIDNTIVSTHTQYDDEGNEVKAVTFPFRKNESEGTIKYFSLAYPIIDALDNGKRLIIDEFDSKMHPLLTCRIIALFNSKETNPKNAQLIFTTHDTNLLSANIFRRDQIWFTQKDRYGATELYSLAEYKVRNDASFEKDYLSGKYGAIPIVGDLTRLFNTQER